MAMPSILHSVLLRPKTAHSATCFFLHGLGDTGSGWMQVAAEMQSRLPYMKFVLPTAPVGPVTINGGMSMNRWYDIGDFQGLDRELCPGLDESAVAVRGLIASEIAAGVRADRIVLGGFSQGAALALWSAFALPNAPPPLGAVMCCSGYVPRFDTFSCDASAVQHVPVACFHGSADTVVRTTCGQRAVAKLRESGLADVQWRSYDGMQHEACQEEIDDLVAFISSKVPPL